MPAGQHIAGGGGRNAASVSAVVATIGLLSSLLTIADHLVLSPPASPPLPVTLHLHVEPGILGRISDVGGLEEFGGLARAGATCCCGSPVDTPNRTVSWLSTASYRANSSDL